MGVDYCIVFPCKYRKKYLAMPKIHDDAHGKAKSTQKAGQLVSGIFDNFWITTGH